MLRVDAFLSGELALQQRFRRLGRLLVLQQTHNTSARLGNTQRADHSRHITPVHDWAKSSALNTVYEIASTFTTFYA